MKIKYWKFYLRTLLDIGLKRILRRIFELIKKKFDQILSPKILFYFYGIKKNKIKFVDTLNQLQIRKLTKKEKQNNKLPRSISFNFLNQRKKLIIPFSWNNKNWSRLWQFNLHYFDWSKDLINSLIEGKYLKISLYSMGLLIDEWINSNPPLKGDGWHSYTISLRCRNWVWIFRCIPELATPKRIESLWEQFQWLYLNTESANGGNHLLENLISLLITSLQFDNEKSIQIYHWALKELRLELKEQILDDGGHFERSAAYHFLILDRLIELACVIEIIKNQRIKWLELSIYKMTIWSKKVRANNKILPPFNDSVKDICPDIEKVLNFAECFLYGKFYKFKDIRMMLLKHIDLDLNNFKFNKIKIPSMKLIDLPFTGWSILRLNKHWEFSFKNGISGPRYLPAHSHSDLLSFNLYYDSTPIFIETGTSIYESGEIRSFERSGKAHNVLQLAKLNQKGKFDWVEPVQVWNSFRAARKSSLIIRKVEEINTNEFCLLAGHNGFNSIGVDYKRKINLKLISKNLIKISISDFLNLKELVYWRLCFHLGPYQKKSILSRLIKNMQKEYGAKYYWEKGWYAERFGKKKLRNSLYILGSFSKGEKVINSDLIINANKLDKL